MKDLEGMESRRIDRATEIVRKFEDGYVSPKSRRWRCERFCFFCQFMRDVAFQGANMYIFVLSKMFFYVFCPIQSLFVRLR